LNKYHKGKNKKGIHYLKHNMYQDKHLNKYFNINF